MTDFCSIESSPLLTLEQTLERIRQTVRPVAEIERLNLAAAQGRVLAEDIVSALNLPSDNNAAMDGYAIASKEIRDGGFQLKLAGTSWAGKPYREKVRNGECVRIFTGGVVPRGADTVVMQEKVTAEDGIITFPARIKPGDNVRLCGEDIKQGEVIGTQGTRLTPASLGLLAAAGVFSVPVYRELNAAYFSTGDELVSAGQALQTGQIYDSNSYLMRGLLTGASFNPVDLGVVPDDEARLAQIISEAAASNDVIISTGGASVGDADYVRDVLAKLGQVGIWKIAVKPGKPLVFGMIGSCCYFGLPGNPVSMQVIFQQVVAPMLSLMSGAREPKRLRISAVCISSLKKTPGRLEFQRGILSQDADGRFFVASAGRQGSHILSSMSRSNCYIILPAESSGVNPGETVLVEPFNVDL